MPVSALPQAPFRQDRKTFPTPLIGDVVFSEIRDCTRSAFPEYGTPHPNEEKWPYHKLVFIKSVDIERDGLFEFFYAADRDSQDLYNFQFSQADIGGVKFDSVVRTYVSPRAEFVPTKYVMGSTMPTDPDDVFEGTFVLSEYRQVDQQEQVLSSLYVTEQLTYIKKITLVGALYDERTGRGSQNKKIVFYRGEYTPEYPENTADAITIEDIFSDPTHPYWGLQSALTNIFRAGEQLSDNWFAVQESYISPPESSNGSTNPAKRFVVTRPTALVTDVIFVETGTMPDTIPAYGSPHYDTAQWPNHKLSSINPSSGDSSGRIFDFYYVADRPSQDLYNFQFSQADIGGVKFDSVVRTYVTPRAGYVPTTYVMGSAMSTSPDGIFTGAYVLSEYKQVDQQEQVLSSLYVTEQLTYVKKVLLIQHDFDETFGANLKTIQFLAYATEVLSDGSTAAQAFFTSSNYFGYQAGGIVRSGKQLSAKWYAITESEVIPSFMLGVGRTYYTTANYSWPAELEPSLGQFDSWEKRAGGAKLFFSPIYAKNSYSGPCRAMVQETFSSSPIGGDTAKAMEPLAINISNPYYSVSIEPTLHPNSTFEISNGTEDIEYKYTVASYNIAATNPITRPSQIVASDEVKPFRGGYLRQVTTVFAPIT
jgi:hypothetical protein